MSKPTSNSTIKLITLVKQHPCLYDCRDEHFKNTVKKTMIWKKIAKEIDRNCDSTKIKWKNLKDGYIKYKKKFNDGTNKNGYANWIWGPYLNFLDSALQTRRQPHPALLENEVVFKENETKIEAASLSSNDSQTNARLSIEFESKDEWMSSPAPPQIPSSPPLPKKRPNTQDDAIDKVLAYLNNRERKDSIDLLFASYAKTLKTMTPKTQASLKLKIAQIFSEAELEDLQQPEAIASEEPALCCIKNIKTLASDDEV